MSPDTASFHALLSIDQEHQLVVVDSRSRNSQHLERESHLLRELDSSQQTIAHYRVWTQQSLLPPYRRQNGWEKYSPGMDLLDREVRYTMPPSGNALH